MNRPDKGDLIAKALRDGLSEAEKHEWTRLLEQEPELRATFAEEQALERMLDALADVPISSNFTALAIQAAMKPEPPRRRGFRLPVLHFALGRAVVVLVGVAAVGIAVGVKYQHREQDRMAMKVRSFTELASAISSEKTGPEELFQNFEAIQRLPAGGEGELDMELLVALQK